MGNFVYSFIKSSWGVQVRVTASLEPIVQGATKYTRINDKLYLANDASFVSQNEFDHMIMGASLVATRVAQARENLTPLLLRILEIDYSSCDYQEEGIACAVAGFLARELDFDMPVVDVTFSEDQGRYVFDFPVTVQQ